MGLFGLGKKTNINQEMRREQRDVKQVERTEEGPAEKIIKSMRSRPENVTHEDVQKVLTEVKYVNEETEHAIGDAEEKLAQLLRFLDVYKHLQISLKREMNEQWQYEDLLRGNPHAPVFVGLPEAQEKWDECEERIKGLKKKLEELEPKLIILMAPFRDDVLKVIAGSDATAKELEAIAKIGRYQQAQRKK